MPLRFGACVVVAVQSSVDGFSDVDEECFRDDLQRERPRERVLDESADLAEAVESPNEIGGGRHDEKA